MFTLNCKGRLLVIDTPVVMGILNITPDSFYASSRVSATSSLLAAAEKMINEGATILDLGAQSTRPGSERITDEDELKRLLEPIEQLAQHFPETYISVDTYYSTVARRAVEAGASIVNDIGGGRLDPRMIATVSELGVPYICMHMKGMPETMQHDPVYENVTREVLDFFIERRDACNKNGINDLIIDPGFGFGKTHAHNFQLLKELDTFKMLELPILAGLSRKGTIYKTLGTTADHALNGTTVLNTVALLKGASILRVHDVREATEAIRLLGQMSIYP